MSPWMAPQAAIAADTPQIETAVESMTESSSSSFSFRASQKRKYQTAEDRDEGGRRREVLPERAHRRRPFALSIWWTFRKGKAAGGERPSARVIWERFPKFVLEFVAASLVFSFVLDPATVTATKGTLGALRTTWFVLAFTCIGLETRLGDLVSMQRGRPAAAFVGAQAFNVAWTLALAYLLFGGVLFATPVFK